MSDTVLEIPAPFAAGAPKKQPELSQAYGFFQQPWWLDTVALGAWDQVIVERDHHVVARLPFVVKRRFGITALTQPPLTRYLGPWLELAEGKYETRLGRQKELMMDLISNLPRHDLFRQRFATDITNWLPFYWAKFDATPVYTYRIEEMGDEASLWAEVNSYARTQIRKALRKTRVRTDLGIDAMLELMELTYARHGWQMPDRDLVYRMDEACAARGCRQHFVAEDAQGRHHASYYIGWDSRCAYAVGGGTNHELATSGAATLVRWEAVRFARGVVHAFDFFGSMMEPVERAFRRLGGRQTLSFYVHRMSRRMRVLEGARELMKTIAR
jgi:hypothetical protein